MAQYMLSVHGTRDDTPPPADAIKRMYADVDALNRELQAEGHWVFACGLHPIDTATVVRVTDGQTVTTDGPYAETKEFLGGFWILEASDLDQALALAERASAACQGAVEVRPLQELPESSDGPEDPA